MAEIYSKSYKSLIRFYIYAFVALLLCLNLYDGYIDGYHLLSFDFNFILFGLVIIFIILVLFTNHFFRSIKQTYKAEGSIPEPRIFYRLLQFPRKLGYFIVLICLLLSIIYHITEVLVLEVKVEKGDLFHHIIIEFCAGVCISMLFRSVARIHIYPLIRTLNVEELNKIKPHSLFWQWFGIFTSLFLLLSLGLIFIVRDQVHKHMINLAIIVIFSIVMFLFGYYMVRLLISGFLREIHYIRNAMTQIVGGKDNSQLSIPVTSNDEIGQLTGAFNALQFQIAREYERIKSELQIAQNLQKYMLPPRQLNLAGYEVHCYTHPAYEVGGDIYDIYERSDGSVVIMIGDVSGKGMSAAIVMSAVLSLFRLEVQKGGRAAELLQRMNVYISEALKGRMMVTLGVAVIDTHSNTLTYANAGHIPPFLVTKTGVHHDYFGSLPLGFDVEENYEEKQLPLYDEDTIVFITDGVLEQIDSQGEMLGFENILDKLSQIERNDRASEKSRKIMNLMSMDVADENESKENNVSIDDRTILIVHKLH